jgi:hypothetical protein
MVRVNSHKTGFGSGCQRIVALVLLIGSCVWGPQVEAATGGNDVFPPDRKGQPAYSTQSGLRIEVDTSWAGSDGYRPVRVTVSAAKPVTAEVLLTIRMRMGEVYRNMNHVIAEKDFSLVQGAASVTTTILVPQLQPYSATDWEIWVDGVKDVQLSTNGMNPVNQSNDQFTALLYRDSGSSRPGFVQNYVLRYGNANFDFIQLDSKNFPETWLGYSGLSVVAMTADEFLTLQAEAPESIVALLRYVRSGGNLWIFDTGENYSKLGAIDNPLGINGNADAEEEGEDPTARGWKNLPLGDGRVQRPGYRIEYEEEAYDYGDISTPPPTPEPSPKRIIESGPKNSHRWFMARSYGMGLIAAFQNVQGSERALVMDAVDVTRLAERLSWRQRHGNDPQSANTDFNDWLIPDVGTAPVLAFQLLISLFVIGIGPLNYWLLKRKNQLPLLLVTVPVAALATTLMLFAYGFLVDGFSIRVRARSLTVLDQRAGEAASWARLSYYAGMAPADGLVMPTDTAVYPIFPARDRYRYSGRYRETKEILWGEEQRLTRGWLSSRTPTQYLTVAARNTDKKLQFQYKGDSLTVKNHLGVEIVSLVIQDHEGRWYQCGELDSSGTTKLLPVEERNAMKELRKLFTDNQPQLPVDYIGGRRGYYPYEDYTISSNLMEMQLNSILSPVGSSWTKGSYVAVTRQGVEVSLGHPEAVESDSFHVIRGTW